MYRFVFHESDVRRWVAELESLLARATERFGDSWEKLYVMNELGLALYSVLDFPRIVSLQQSVLELSRSVFGERHRDTRLALQNLGDTLNTSGLLQRDGDPRLRSLWEELSRANQLPWRTLEGEATLSQNPV